MFKKILAAIDLTESQMTMQAIDKAAALARAFDGELRLVNVQTLIPIAFLDFPWQSWTRKPLVDG